MAASTGSTTVAAWDPTLRASRGQGGGIRRCVDGLQAVRRRQEPVFPVLAQDCLDVARPKLAAGRQARGDPARLGGQLRLLDIPFAPGAVEEDDRDEATAGDEPDEQQPPLELGHQRWPRVRRIGASLRAFVPSVPRGYTPRR